MAQSTTPPVMTSPAGGEAASGINMSSADTGTAIAPGQDFVLFDPVQATPEMNGLDPMQSSNPAFTEFRGNAPGHNMDSPFSSPASRHDDEVHQISAGVAPQMSTSTSLSGKQTGSSGTLAKGTPRSKRPRGHGYSSSWTNGNIQQHLDQWQHAQPPPPDSASGNVPPSLTYTGLPPVGPGSDWSGSDTSPRNPPSGSLGPPIQSLSLGDAAPEKIGSLFPSGQTDDLPVLSSSDPSVGHLTAAQQQEDRARQQIRADLQGVDSRALKGQLRDIQQGATRSSPMMQNLSIGPEQGNILFPNVPPSMGASEAPSQNALGTSNMATHATPRSSHVDHSQMNRSMQDMMDSNVYVAVTAAAEANNQANENEQRRPLEESSLHEQSSSTSPPNHPPRRFSERTQKAVDRARAQKPTRKRMLRDRSGLTISPQEAFLDYDNVDAMLQSSQAPDGSSLKSTNNIFAAPPSFTATPPQTKSEEAEQLGTPRATPTSLPFDVVSQTMETTPSLVESGSSASTESTTSRSVASPLQRQTLERGDTARPSALQLASQAYQQSNSQGDAEMSPADSIASSTDDEESRTNMLNESLSSRITDSYPQASNFPGTWTGPQVQPAQRTNYTMHSGPRFSFVSSSSSESEDEGQRRLPTGGVGTQGAMHPSRRMGGYGYMGGSEESGLSVAPVSQAQQMAALSRAGIPPVTVTTDGLPLNSDTLHKPPQDMYGTPYNYAFNQGSTGFSHDAPSESGSQSQDEGPRLSPSIRSSAQPLYPTHGPHAHFAPNFAPPVQAQPVIAPNQVTRPPEIVSDDTEGDISETSEQDSEGSAYRESPPTTKKSSRRTSRAIARKRRSGETHGEKSSSHLTTCNYVSPLTGEVCGTEFHRPYDLARHRETIHAREEATLLKQGQITKDQCVVLYKEVDPAKSLATVEWRCDGPNGCGALFSRKDGKWLILCMQRSI